MTAPGPATLPELPLDGWADTKDTLHLCCQIVGKIRMALHPKQNHWWHVPLYVSARGLTTRAIPWRGGHVEIAFDFLDNKLVVTTADGAVESFELGASPVCDFNDWLFAALIRCGIEVSIVGKPYDHTSTLPFAEDNEHAAWDIDAIRRYWQILAWTDGVMKVFAGRFVGKQTPPHLFWHSFDLALTRFSGRAAPPMTGGTQADREAYSHEVISVGFWPGDDKLPEPAYYAYTYPEPPGLANADLDPEAAFWNDADGNAMAILKYADLRGAADPRSDLLAFFESTYRAGANLADWPIESLRHTAPGLDVP